MAINKASYVERVVTAFNPDGTIKGSHAETLETITDGAEVISAKYASAMPVSAGDLALIFPDRAALIAQVQSLNDALDKMTAERDALKKAE